MIQNPGETVQPSYPCSWSFAGVKKCVEMHIFTFKKKSPKTKTTSMDISGPPGLFPSLKRCLRR